MLCPSQILVWTRSLLDLVFDELGISHISVIDIKVWDREWKGQRMTQLLDTHFLSGSLYRYEKHCTWILFLTLFEENSHEIWVHSLIMCDLWWEFFGINTRLESKFRGESVHLVQCHLIEGLIYGALNVTYVLAKYIGLLNLKFPKNNRYILHPIFWGNFKMSTKYEIYITT